MIFRLPIVSVIAFTAALLAGCNAAPITDIRENTARVAVLPVVNLSGRDLLAVPDIFWESSGTQRVLTRIMRTRVFLERMPFEDGELDRMRSDDPAGPLAQLTWDGELHELVWAEVMTPDDKLALQALSDDAAWLAAIDELFVGARRNSVNILDKLQTAVVAHLERIGFAVTDLGREMPRTDKAPSTTGNDPTYRERIRQAAAATKATSVLSVAIEEFDWTDIFETRELRVSLRAVLADPTDGSPVWNRTTGTILCKIPDQLVVGGSINLGKAYDDYLVQLAGRLFD